MSDPACYARFFFSFVKQRIENMEGTRVKGALLMLELHPLLAL